MIEAFLAMVMIRFRKNFAGKLSLATGSLLIGLVLVEVGLRLTAKLGPRPSLAEDPVLGWDSAPSESTVGNEEKGVPVIFLGDSFTQNNHWPDQVAQTLRLPGINVGASGFGTYQEWLKLRQLLLSRPPALVVVQFYAWNDLRDNWAWPALGYNPEMLSRPYLSPEGVEFRPAYPWKWLDGFRVTSYFGKRRLVAAWQKADRTMRTGGVDAVAARRETLVAGLCAEESWLSFYLPNRQEGEFVRGAWEVTESCFGQMAEACARKNIPLLVLALDAPFTVDADKWRFIRAKYPALDPELPLSHLKRFLDHRGIPAVWPQEALRLWGRTSGQSAYDGDAESLTGHLTPGGQRVVAREVARAARKLVGGGEQGL